ncbi:hypothetical protein ACIQOW_27650 [Kitasatospora sp. NPDC091335]|uniref:hypothetical protein n=1 Tax=Kitasatospora sp. NPDC091335 TaxID=3364085 RepID=UPI00381AD1AB
MDPAHDGPAGAGHGRRPAPRPGSRAHRTAHRLGGFAGRVAAVVGCLVLACTSCAAAGGEVAVLTQAELVGDWSNAAGARVHLSADHSLTADGIDHAMHGYSCSTSMKAGKWRVWEPSGSADEGTNFSISPDNADLPSWCGLEAQVQHDAKGFNICLYLDPDGMCSAEELLRKEPAPPR